MIKSLRLTNFKNFADETLRLGPFTVIVGANASGKSNLRDAFRFLHGIGSGYTLPEIFGGKYGPGGQREWSGIRGAPNEIMRFEEDEFSVEVETNTMRYHIDIADDFLSVGSFLVSGESLQEESDSIYQAKYAMPNLVVRGDEPYDLELVAHQPALSQSMLGAVIALPYIESPVVRLLSSFGHMRFFEFDPDRIREPAFPGQQTLGDRGENMPAVLETICAEPDLKRNLISWLEGLTPMDVTDLEFPRDPSGRIHLQIVDKNDRKVSAYSASDGTLRFLAILAALFSPSASGIYFFEEIDNGIHPNRVWLLMDLLQNEAVRKDAQIITTTHSPQMLTFMNDDTFESASVVYRDEDYEDAIIRPLADIGDAKKLRKADGGLGELHATGWMETILGFDEFDRRQRASQS